MRLEHLLSGAGPLLASGPDALASPACRSRSAHEVAPGGLAQLARALAWHARGHRFESDILHFRLFLALRSLTFCDKTASRKQKFERRLSLQPPGSPPGHVPVEAGSESGRMVDALAQGGDEGRGKLRKSAVRRNRPLTRRCPNGTTPRPAGAGPPQLRRGQRGELKHLSTRRKRKQQ